jgi:glycerophosphoryl diester phosphodiesterase
MIILAHRGFWHTAVEKNSLEAFERAFAAGFGVELDVRDFDGELVISHDPARATCPRFALVLALYRRYGMPGRLAINIKADGLAPQIARMTDDAGMRKAVFVFDMSIPDMISYVEQHIPTFSRCSEYERTPALPEACAGVWLDAFTTPWADESRMTAFLDEGKAVALVSPELHGKPHEEAWSVWRSALRATKPGKPVMICTDLPAEAKRFFLDEKHD